MERSIKQHNNVQFAIIAAIYVLILYVSIKLIPKMTAPKFTYIEDSKKQQRYVDWITPIAKEVGKEFGIPWQAVVVQTALESGFGKSKLTREYNNFAGVKAVGSQLFVEFKTKEQRKDGSEYVITSKFRKWDTPIEGLKGYALFFKQNRRYAKALQFPDDAIRFIEEIKAAGYATDVNYVSKLTRMINKYNLV